MDLQQEQSSILNNPQVHLNQLLARKRSSKNELTYFTVQGARSDSISIPIFSALEFKVTASLVFLASIEKSRFGAVL